MKRIFLAILLLLALASLLLGQSVGPILISSTQCASIGTDQMGTVSFQVVGTWTGTLTPYVAQQGQPLVATFVTPWNSATPALGVTANGGYSVNVAGKTVFKLCGNTVASGTARVYLNASPATR